MRRLLRKIDSIIKPGKIGKVLNPNIYPNNKWYRKHLERNYDVAILGDSAIIPRIKIPLGVKAFDWSLDSQNLLWDFNVIKHFFSILKPNGYVIFPLTDNFIADLFRRVDERRYYIPMMPYFFTQSKIKMTYIRICKRIPLLALFPVNMTFKKWGGCSEEFYDKANMLISNICMFLSERNLKPCFVLITNKKDNELTRLISLFEGKELYLKILSTVDDYNWETIKMIINNGNK